MQGKVILVFGGAGGIGAETAHRLAAAGARLVLADLRGDQAQAQAALVHTYAATPPLN